MDDTSSYEIKNLDAESVGLAIEGCLPYISDEELQTLADCFQYAPGDIKPSFLVATSESKYLKDLVMLYNGKQAVLHSFYGASNKVNIIRKFQELREIIDKIKGFINTWDEILEEKPGEMVGIVPTVVAETQEETDGIEKYSMNEDITAVDKDGNPINLSQDTYDIDKVEEIDGETDVHITADGESYSVKDTENEIEDSTESEIVNEEATLDTTPQDISKVASALGTLLGGIAAEFNIITYFEENGIKYGVVPVNGKYYRIEVDEKGKIKAEAKPKLIDGSYTVVDDNINITVDGTEIEIKKGRYIIIAIKDLNGKRYGLVLIDGKYYWVELDSNNRIVPNTEVKAKEETTIVVTDPITVIEATTNEETTITPGKYTVVDVDNTVTPNQVIVETPEDNYTIVEIDENNEIIPESEETPIEPVEVEVISEVEVIVDNNNVTVTPGNYTIIAIKEFNGNKYGLVFIDGEYCWVPLDANNNIISGETISVNSLNYNLSDELTFVINGETFNITPGEYQVLKVMPLSDGGHAECILVNGKYVWVYFDHNGNFVNALYEIETDGVYTINTQLEIIDGLGNNAGLTNQYNYRIYAIRYDQFGNITAIRISPPGYPEQWVIVRKDGVDYGSYTKFENAQTNPNNTVSYSYFSNHKVLLGCLIGLATVLGGAIIYKKKKGSKEKIESYTVDDGDYPVFEEEKDENGNVNAVRISNDEDDDEYWMEVE